MIRFIHAADIHLDSPLRGLDRYEGAPVERLRGATRAAFANLVAKAIDEKVDFVVIAGDLYDGDWRDANTGLYFAAQMGRLRQAGIRCVVLHGNHDAESEITRTLSLPDNVHVFGHRRPETFAFEDLRVAFHGQSFRTPETIDPLHQAYPPPRPGWLNVGVLHTAMEGNSEHARYAPCTVQELAARGYHYWALGHVHARNVVAREPWIVFPGNLQGRHVRETGARGAMLVSAQDDRILGAEPFDCDVLRWVALDIDVTGLEDRDAMLQAVELSLAAACDASSVPIAARVTLTGRTRLHGRLAFERSTLRDDVLSRANGLGDARIWIEKVKLATSPLVDAADIGARDDALADIARMLSAAHEDPGLIETIRTDLQAVMASLPAELRDGHTLPELMARDDAEVAALIRRGAAALVDRLAEG
jgi:exonuclease SbcD